MLSAAQLAPPNLGVLLVDPSGSGAANFSANANVNVTHGDFAVDSTNSSAAALSGNAQLTAGNVYLAGRATTVANSHLTGTMDTGWSGETDPLSGLAQPSLPGTTFTVATINGRSMTLSPGAYTNAVTITGNSNITLLPGLYYFEHGITISGNARLSGTGVTIYNASGAINLSGNAAVTISAPTTGTYSGIALFQNRADSSAIVANGNAAVKLTGDLYAPDATLNLSGNAAVTVAGNNATIPGAVIVRDLMVSGNGRLSVAANTIQSVDLVVTKTDSAGGTSDVFQSTLDTLHTFVATNGIEGDSPISPLTQFGSKLYGEDADGGTSFVGTVFSMNLDGSDFTILHTFDGSDGSFPEGGLAISADGSTLYGVSEFTGLDTFPGSGDGSVFSVSTDGSTFSVLHAFDGADGANPIGGLTLSGSTLYGTVDSGGPSGLGGVFKLGANGGNYSLLAPFTSIFDDTIVDFADQMPLVVSGSTIYGVADYGGASDDGAVFSLGTSGGTINVLHSFDGSDGETPYGGLTLSGTTLYGSTNTGGANGDGELFKINTDGSGFSAIYSFNGTNGGEPVGNLALSGSILYGVANGLWFDGQDEIAFGVSTSGVLVGSTIIPGTDQPLSGSTGGVTLDGSIIYLTSAQDQYGAALALGLPPQINAGGPLTYTITVANDGPNSATGVTVSDLLSNIGGLTSDAYTAVASGGASGFTASGSGNIHDVVNLPNGSSITYTVTANIAATASGTLTNTATATVGTGEINTNLLSVAGTTSATDIDTLLPDDVDIAVTKTDSAGGTSAGIAGTVTPLTSFDNGDDIAPQSAPVTFGSKIYGEANGEVYSVNDDGSDFTVLYSTNGMDGFFPSGGLAISADGSTLYGTTYEGGTDFRGDIFSLSTSGGTPNTLYSFTGGTDGGHPLAGVTLSGSKLYGTTSYFGANGDGTVFSVNTDGTGFATLAAFDDGGFFEPPPSEPALTVSGTTIYGVDEIGDDIYSLSTGGGTINVLHIFNVTDGEGPDGPLLVNGSTIYGTAFAGGADFDGVVYRMNTDGSGFSVLYSFLQDGFGNGEINPTGNLVLSGNMLYGTAAAAVFGIGTYGGAASFSPDIGGAPIGLAKIGSTFYVTTAEQLFALTPPPVAAGSQLVYTVTVSNSGPGNAGALTLSDLLAGNADYTSDTFTAVGSGGAAGFTASGSGNINNVVDLPSGGSVTYTITAQINVSATGILSNTATATVGAGEINTNPASVNGSTSATDNDMIVPEQNDNLISGGTVTLGGTLRLPTTPTVSGGTLIVPAGGTITLAPQNPLGVTVNVGDSTGGTLQVIGQLNGLSDSAPVNAIIATPITLASGSTGALPYTGVITVGGGETLIANQILAGGLVIVPDSTVTIAPSLKPPA